jgi:putative hemolysin
VDLALGLVLICLTLYTSVLTLALRGYSRAGLKARIPESRQALWSQRLDDREPLLQDVLGVTRMLSAQGLVTWVFYDYLIRPGRPADGADLLTAALVAALLLLFVLVAIPNAIARSAADAVMARNLGVIWFLSYLLFPIGRVLGTVDFVVRRLAGRPDASAADSTEQLEREILEVVHEGEMQGAVDEGQKEMIRSVIELRETTVGQIMTPRTDIVAVHAAATLDDVRTAVAKAGHSRIPVYESTVDHIVGVVYAKDLLRFGPQDALDLRKVMRAAPYVPATKSIAQLLEEFRAAKVQIAIVLDEYGGTAGLATIEDILEELVGEIADEHDQRPAPSVDRVDEDTLEVDARVPIYEVNAELGVSLPEHAEYETIGGFAFSALGRIPTRGEEFAHENVHFRVMDAEPRRIRRLRVHVQREAATT